LFAQRKFGCRQDLGADVIAHATEQWRSDTNANSLAISYHLAALLLFRHGQFPPVNILLAPNLNFTLRNMFAHSFRNGIALSREPVILFREIEQSYIAAVRAPAETDLACAD
jgi:hypothetical protein